MWYLMTMLLDCTIGMFLAYLLFKVVDEIAIRFGIETLKSGVYTEKNVPVEATDDFDPDEYIDVRIWFIQVIVWVMCTFIAKIVVFFIQLRYHTILVQTGEKMLAGFKGSPKLELVVVMIIIPVTLNSLMFWVQDSFLKGDKHMDKRKQE